MRSGRLFRYAAASSETSQASLAEVEFAAYVKQRYAVGVNSGASALVLALLAAGVAPGDQVVTNGFAFTAVPSTVMRLGAEPVLVETTMSWTMDLDDLEAKLDAFPDARVLLLSHTRGKVADMDRILRICDAKNIALVEDCAQAMGVTWKGLSVGSFGLAAAYSTQSDKVVNSGEGGFATTDDDAVAAKLIYLSGCYERRYGKHASRPPDDLCEAGLGVHYQRRPSRSARSRGKPPLDARRGIHLPTQAAMLEIPNLSSRMSEVAAAVARPLIKSLPERIPRYNARYTLVVEILRAQADGAILIPDQQ